jgi:hypothetical protein
MPQFYQLKEILTMAKYALGAICATTMVLMIISGARSEETVFSVSTYQIPQDAWQTLTGNFDWRSRAVTTGSLTHAHTFSVKLIPLSQVTRYVV